jgi:hypothetical protein
VKRSPLIRPQCRWPMENTRARSRLTLLIRIRPGPMPGRQ